jgi:outer membrane protein
VKNLSLILNGILIVAVAILFYLHFSSPKTSTSTEGTTVEKADSTNSLPPVKLPEIRSVNGPIAYINYDVLVDKYKYYKDLENQFEGFAKRKESELAKKEQSWMESVERYKQLGESMTPEARAQREQQLSEEQNNLLMLREQMRAEVAEKQANLNKDFLKKIDDYLKQLSKQKNYSYVFTYSKGGPATIVFANDSLEITNQVIEGLNKGYK